MKTQKYFSASTGGFYSDAIHGDKIPSDAVAINDEQYRVVHAQHIRGHKIVADERGYPITVPPPPGLSLGEVMRLTQAKKALQDSDIVILRAYEDGEPVPQEWVAYRRALREVVAGTRSELPQAPNS